MKRCVSGLVAVLLLLTCLTTAGCGGGGSGGGAVAGGGGGGGPNPQFSVANFGGADLATLMSSYQPPTETTGTNASFTATSTNRGTAARTEVDLRDNHSQGDTRLFDDGYYTIPRSLEPIEPIYNGVGPADVEQARTAVSSRGAALPRFQAMAEGAVENFTIVANNNLVVPCQKMHADNETQFCTIFAEQVGGTPIVNKARALHSTFAIS